MITKTFAQKRKGGDFFSELFQPCINEEQGFKVLYTYLIIFPHFINEKQTAVLSLPTHKFASMYLLQQ